MAKTEAVTSRIKIERIDNLPIIFKWLKKMRVQPIIDGIWQPHGNWQGLTYGQLAVLFIAYVIQRRTHNLSKMEEWTMRHQTVIERVTGWSIREKEATDDRIGMLLTHLGSDKEKMYQMQRQLSRQQIQAYQLPTRAARYDTTSFSVHHEPAKKGEQAHQLLKFGYSKDHRPDLLQFKQGLGTLDPCGIPLFTQTLSGETADDGLYVTAWREMAAAIGHTQFLYVADCKAGGLTTRATIDKDEGRYLFPIPLTGETPTWLAEQLKEAKPQKIVLPEVVDKQGMPKQYGQGFSVVRKMQQTMEDGTMHHWTEQWLVHQSQTHQRRRQHALKARIERTHNALTRLRPRRDENADQLLARANQLLTKHKTASFFNLDIETTVTERKRYLKRGRPSATTPFELITETRLSLTFSKIDSAIAQAHTLAGWRIFVSNVPQAAMSLVDAVMYYRDEWQVEHGMHRFKKGSLPALPLAIRIAERIHGLMLLLFIALQALTLIEFVAARSLAQEKTTLAGLVPGNPKRKTARPSAERLLAAFEYLHLLVEQHNDSFALTLNESLSDLQLRILRLLQLPPDIYFFGNVAAPP